MKKLVVMFLLVTSMFLHAQDGSNGKPSVPKLSDEKKSKILFLQRDYSALDAAIVRANLQLVQKNDAIKTAISEAAVEGWSLDPITLEYTQLKPEEKK